MLYSSGVLGATTPQKSTALATPNVNAAIDPAKLFPRLILGVYLPQSLPKVLAAVSHQLNSRTHTTATSFLQKYIVNHKPPM